MQEFGNDAKETAKLRKKSLRQSVDQARLEKQHQETLRAKQQSTTTIDLSTNNHLDYTGMPSDNNEFADRRKSDSEEDLLLKQERCLK